MESTLKTVYPVNDFEFTFEPHGDSKGIDVTDEQIAKLKSHELKFSLDKDGEIILVSFNKAENERILNANGRIMKLKDFLSATDYQAIKYAEGLISASDYAPIKAKREMWRKEINDLEKTL